MGGGALTPHKKQAKPVPYGVGPTEIWRGLRLSQTHELSIPRLAKHTLRIAK